MIGWLKPDDTLLAYDRSGNGRIDDIDELFGNRRADDFADLEAEFDSNNDNVINASDTQFGDLLIWQDANSDDRFRQANCKLSRM